MIGLFFTRRSAVQSILALVAMFVLVGCTSDNSTFVGLAGRSFQATNMTLGALKGDLQMNTGAVGNTITGVLTLTDPTRAIHQTTRLVIATPNCNGTYDPVTGAVTLTGSFENPAGTTHNFTIAGTLPTSANNNQGSINITIDGANAGPFVFGDNNPTGGNNTGLVISGSTANATSAANGVYTATVGVEKSTQSFTLNGVTYDGQHTIVVFKQGSGFSFDVFGLNVTSGQSFSLPVARLHLSFAEGLGSKLYVANSGTFKVESLSATSMTVTLTNVKFVADTSATGTTGEFTVNGSVTGTLSSE